MGSLGLETVLVGDVAQLDLFAARSGILDGSLDFFGFGVFVTGVLQYSLFVSRDTITGLIGRSVGAVEVDFGILADDRDRLISGELGSAGYCQQGEKCYL